MNWPGDARFAWDIRGQVLWAYTRAHAVALAAHVASAERRDRGEFEYFLRHVPSKFLDAELRDVVVARITKTLAE